MIKGPRLWHVLILGIVLFGFTYLGVGKGWFTGMYFIDIPLHIIAGVIIGMFWWWLTSRFRVDLGRLWATLMSFIGFSLLVSLLWEIYEYINWKYFAEVTPRWELFSPTVSDVLADFAFGVFGTLLVSVVYVLYRRRQERLNSISS